jgi:hypothetical protein
MFSALKRLTGKAEGGNNVARPGHQSMSHSLQRKFAKGVQYNSKYYIMCNMSQWCMNFVCAFKIRLNELRTHLLVPCLSEWNKAQITNFVCAFKIRLNELRTHLLVPCLSEWNKAQITLLILITQSMNDLWYISSIYFDFRLVWIVLTNCVEMTGTVCSRQ